MRRMRMGALAASVEAELSARAADPRRDKASAGASQRGATAGTSWPQG